MNSKKQHYGFAGRMAAIFAESKLTPLAIIVSILLGAMAVMVLPREEEPQIKVPMIDIMVAMPGVSSSEIANQISIPLEKIMYEIPGVEYVYSTSMAGKSLVVVRCYVGENLDSALVRINQKIESNLDRFPRSASPPLIKPHIIDDVPILALTFHGGGYDHYTLRRIAAQVDDEIKNIQDVAETTLIGGTKRQVRIAFDPAKLAGRNITLTELVHKLRQSNQQLYLGELTKNNHNISLQTGVFIQSAAEMGRIVVGVNNDSPVYLKDVAIISDEPAEAVDYVLFGSAKNGFSKDPKAAVTISIAKRPGSNAVDVVDNVRKKIEVLTGTLIPEDLQVSITRDYGATAAEKSNELLLHMAIAVFGVALLIFFFLGFRESLVVMLAIPSTLALTLMVFYLYGYTLNRITLFALIFSIGILVDDAIVVVENIVRHMHLAANRSKEMLDITVEAVAEVGNPTILATVAVIAAILPMAFVGGLMGPYMRPIPIGSSAAMLFSLIIAFTITPWAAKHLLKKKAGYHDADAMPDDFFTRLYHRVMDPLLAHGYSRLIFFAIIITLLLASISMMYQGAVKVKMLPFDNKSEFQVILDMPEGSTLEETTKVALEMTTVIADDPDVVDYQIYAGTSSPYNFNGLVRHYFMRRGDNVADIQVNLLPKHDRKLQSHDIAKRIRIPLAIIAKQHGASLAVAEVPPGPPVLQTIVAEIYGPTDESRVELATQVKEIFANATGVVDIDWFRETDRVKKVIKIDKEKAALSGVSEEKIIGTIQAAIQGEKVGILHLPNDKEACEIIVDLPTALKSGVDSLLNIHLRSSFDSSLLVPVRELVSIKEIKIEQPIYRKNLKSVLYVTADVAGEVESPVYAILAMNKKLKELGVPLYNLQQPFSTVNKSIKWDGEWHITLEVFRDLGIAFAVVMILIYMLMVGWFKSYSTPLVVMTAIPFSLIGILPAHWAFSAFFTATSMIGFMAGAGIVVRNSIILIDFIELRISEGLPLKSAVVEAGAVRFRPMLLTALAVVIGASVILADPIFQGLAISLMFGEIASLLVSRMAVPVLYYMVKK